MTIKQQGGIFGRNPTFNDVKVEGSLNSNGDIEAGKFIATTSGYTVNPAKPIFGLFGTAGFVQAPVGGEVQIWADSTSAIATFKDNMDVLINAGNLVIGTSGKGIDFSATSGTGTSELFDDYEEGAWTPTLTFATAGDVSVTYSNRLGTYVKVGKMVTISCKVTASAFTHSTASGALRITGTPFSPANNAFSAINFNGIDRTNYTSVAAVVSSGSSVITFSSSGMGQSVSSLTSAHVPSGGAPFVNFTLSYETS